MKKFSSILSLVSASCRSQARRQVHAASKVNPQNDILVEFGCDENNWLRVREIFALTFQQYPLFRYFVPNDTKRPEFLKRYLDAVYDVVMRGGQSTLATFSHVDESTGDTTVVGGSLLVRPCYNGTAINLTEEKDFVDSFERYKLREVDEEGYKRVLRYDEFEGIHILDKVKDIGIPTWYGMFFGIDAAIVGNGNGRNSFDIGVPQLCEIQREEEANLRHNNTTNSFRTKENFTVAKPGFSSPTQDENFPFLILGITHCPRAAKFHIRNGMIPVKNLSYRDDNGRPALDITVIYHDPFQSGATDKIRKEFQKQN